MNIALLLSGQPIFYKECFESLNYFLNKNLKDIFSAHIWWEENLINKPYKLHFKDKIQHPDMDKLFIEKYKIDDKFIEPHKSFDLTFLKKFNYNTWKNQDLTYYRIMTPIVLYGLLSQTYSVYQSFLNIKKYKDIDVVIKSRPDIVYTKNLRPILESLEFSDNKIFFQSSMDGGHIYAGEFPNKPCDWFFVGAPKAVELFCKDWHELIISEYKNGIIHTNEFVQIVCKKNNLQIELIDFGALIYKQISNFYSDYLIDPSFYINDFDLKDFKPKSPEFWPYWIKNIDFNYYKDII